MKTLVRNWLLTPALLLALAAASSAQDGSAVATRHAVVPFGLGERMTFNVRLGIVGQVGTGSMEML